MWSRERLLEASVAAADAGFQLHYHAIGDAAIALSLDAIAAARPQGAAAGARDMITHLQVFDPAEFERFARLGVTALMQPFWFAQYRAYYDQVYVPFLGAERAAHQYPMRSFWEHGVPAAASEAFDQAATSLRQAVSACLDLAAAEAAHNPVAALGRTA